LPVYARGLIFVDEPDRVPQLGLPKLLLKKRRAAERDHDAGRKKKRFRWLMEPIPEA
jgi:hypothetical protein